MSMAQPDISKGVNLPPITTQSSTHCCSTRRKTFWNWWMKIGQKWIAKNPFRTNVRSALFRNDRRWLPSLSHQKKTQISPEILSLFGAADNWRGQGAESGEEVTDDHEGWQFCHYDTTSRGRLSVEIYGERKAGHIIYADRESFGSRSSCTFLAPFYLVLHIPELGLRLKSNNLGNGQYVFLRGSFTPSTSSI